MNDAQLEARGLRAKSAKDEFFDPFFATVRQEYISALTTVAVSEPWATDKITKLAIAQRVIDMVESQINAVIAQGDVAADSVDRAKQIAKLSPARRKLLGVL